jgi:transposase InsO family protein
VSFPSTPVQVLRADGSFVRSPTDNARAHGQEDRQKRCEREEKAHVTEGRAIAEPTDPGLAGQRGQELSQTAPNQLWQTDFTYLKVIGWGWFYLSTVLDDFSRYILAWKLCFTMRTEDVPDTLELALRASGLEQVEVRHRPRLLSDNGSSLISSDLASWLEGKGMSHVRGAPYHPMTQGKIERWHQTLKNRILLENYFLPGDLEVQIEAFVAHYNHRRYHESLGNLTPAASRPPLAASDATHLI